MNGVKETISHSKLYFVLGGLCVLAIGLGIGIVVVLNNNGSNRVDGEVGAETSEEELEESYKDLDDYYKEMDEKIAQAETEEEKAQLYTERAEELEARQASEEQDLTEMILADLYRAEEIAPDANTAWMIFAAENDLGNEEKAMEYLNIAKDRGYKEEEGNG
ncbi:hypothetical protein IKF21_00395 [Candidatus Saccharibacteria bacterium]|nr:hypothetical protein [Candidatus Saccharibacteria bacterium]